MISVHLSPINIYHDINDFPLHIESGEDPLLNFVIEENDPLIKTFEQKINSEENSSEQKRKRQIESCFEQISIAKKRRIAEKSTGEPKTLASSKTPVLRCTRIKIDGEHEERCTALFQRRNSHPHFPGDSDHVLCNPCVRIERKKKLIEELLQNPDGDPNRKLIDGVVKIKRECTKVFSSGGKMQMHGEVWSTQWHKDPSTGERSRCEACYRRNQRGMLQKTLG